MKTKVRCDGAGAVDVPDWTAFLRDSQAERTREDERKRPAPAPAPPSTGVEVRVRLAIPRAVIGDELRTPIAWCEMPSCISRYADRAALGEADIRARAIAAGWRVDGLGRLACRECQQSSPLFWPAHPPVLWDRDTAITMALQMAVAALGRSRRGAPAVRHARAPWRRAR